MCEDAPELIFIRQHKESTVKLLPGSKSGFYILQFPTKKTECFYIGYESKPGSPTALSDTAASQFLFCNCMLCVCVCSSPPYLLPLLPFFSFTIFPPTVACLGIRLWVSVKHLEKDDGWITLSYTMRLSTIAILSDLKCKRPHYSGLRHKRVATDGCQSWVYCTRQQWDVQGLAFTRNVLLHHGINCSQILQTYCICVWNGLGVSSKGSWPNSPVKPLSAASLSTIIIGVLTCAYDFQNGEVSETNYVALDFLSRKTERQTANMALPQPCIYSVIHGWKDIKSDV